MPMMEKYKEAMFDQTEIGSIEFMSLSSMTHFGFSGTEHTWCGAHTTSADTTSITQEHAFILTYFESTILQWMST